MLKKVSLAACPSGRCADWVVRRFDSLVHSEVSSVALCLCAQGDGAFLRIAPTVPGHKQNYMKHSRCDMPLRCGDKRRACGSWGCRSTGAPGQGFRFWDLEGASAVFAALHLGLRFGGEREREKISNFTVSQMKIRLVASRTITHVQYK
jgi:hypothetical protein